MRHRWLPKERPDHFEINSDCWLSRGLVFAGLGGLGCHHSSRFADSSWYQNHGTLTNMDPATDWVWVPELGRWALDFDGSNDFISCENPDVFPRLGGPYSLSAFAKCTGGSVAPEIIKKHLSYNLRYVNSTSPLETYAWSPGGTRYKVLDSKNNDSAWHHVAATFQATSLSLYRDGSATGSGSTFAQSGSSAYSLFIGDNGIGGEPFGGAITDVLIHNRVLFPAEIVRLADPSNVMLEMGGVPLIQHRRTWWPVAVAGTTIRWPWQQRRHRRMAGAR